jgi:hypothetical protein
MFHPKKTGHIQIWWRSEVKNDGCEKCVVAAINLGVAMQRTKKNNSALQ